MRVCVGSRASAVCLSFGPTRHNFTVSVTEARPGAAASVSRRRRERRTLLAGGGRRASRSHTLAASQAFERMHMLFCHKVKIRHTMVAWLASPCGSLPSQVATRVLSACPALYWWLATSWLTAGTGIRVCIVLWCTIYSVLGVCMFASYYPWT